MTLTEKQNAWDDYKATQRNDRRRPMDPTVKFGDTRRTGSFYRDLVHNRGVRTPVMPSGRLRGQCRDCPHGWRHHAASGHCRPGCACTNGASR